MAGLALNALATTIPAVLNAVHDVNEMETEQQWRDEDNYRRKWDNIRRLIDEKKHQLEALASLAAVFAGCSMICIVELDVPACAHSLLLVYFNIFSSVAVCLAVLALCNCIILYVVVGKFNIAESLIEPFGSRKRQNMQFSSYWRNVADSLWEQSVIFFGVGVICFLMALASLGWLKFWDRLPGKRCTVDDPLGYTSNLNFTWAVVIGNVLNSLVFTAGICYFMIQIYKFHVELIRDKTPDNDPLENQQDYIPRGLQQFFTRENETESKQK